MDELNQIEKDFIDFISKKRGRSYQEIEEIFLATKKRFKFSEPGYRNLCDDVHNLCRIFYDDVNEKELIDSYDFYAPMHIFRLLSYSYGKPRHNNLDRLKSLIKIIIKLQFKKIIKYLSRKYLKNRQTLKLSKNIDNIAEFLVGQLKDSPIVIDYGCGLGYVSFEIGKLIKNSKIYLVDIDSSILEFAEFRFRKHGVNVEVIKVTKDEIYPKLPPHNICIATEVMEHIKNPLIVYENIYHSLMDEGILYGNFSDHDDVLFHPSPDLSQLRDKISKDFIKINENIFKKRK